MHTVCRCPDIVFTTRQDKPVNTVCLRFDFRCRLKFVKCVDACSLQLFVPPTHQPSISKTFTPIHHLLHQISFSSLVPSQYKPIFATLSYLLTPIIHYLTLFFNSSSFLRTTIHLQSIPFNSPLTSSQLQQSSITISPYKLPKTSSLFVYFIFVGYV